MFNQIILTLWLIITFSDNASQPCWYDTEVYWCYDYKTKEIILWYNSPHLNQTFYHEMAHAMFWEEFPWNEELSRSFERYMLDPKFKEQESELTNLFDNKLKSYEKSN